MTWPTKRGLLHVSQEEIDHDDKDDNDEDDLQEQEIESDIFQQSGSLCENLPSWPAQYVLCDQVHSWSQQSCWLFLKPDNHVLTHIGATFTSFLKEITGKHVLIGVWRKVVETHSTETNSLLQQQSLSQALLHQYQTGQDYYVSHDPFEASQQVNQTWTQMMTRTNLSV